MNGNSNEANIEYLIEKNIMQVPNFKYIQPSNSNNHIGHIKYDEEFIYPIKDLDEFYKELGYTKELRFAGVLPDEFIWDTYRKNLDRECIGCLQLLLINYLSKHSDTFRRKYDIQCKRWLEILAEVRAARSLECVNCRIKPLCGT
jgi:hypothetical protein